MVRYLIFATLLLFVACSPTTQTVVSYSPLTSQPSIQSARADVICESQADEAYSSVRADLRSARNSRQSQVTGYQCQTFGTTTNCTPTRRGSGSSKLSALAEGIQEGQSARRAKDRTYRACMAQYGWAKTEREVPVN